MRRREYDALLAARSFQDRTSDPLASDNFFSQFTNFFSSRGTQHPTNSEEDETPEGQRERERAQAFAEGRPDAEGVFGNVFEEVSWAG